MALEMLCFLEPAVTDGTLSQNHDGVRGSARDGAGIMAHGRLYASNIEQREKGKGGIKTNNPSESTKHSRDGREQDDIAKLREGKLDGRG